MMTNCTSSHQPNRPNIHLTSHDLASSPASLHSLVDLNLQRKHWENDQTGKDKHVWCVFFVLHRYKCTQVSSIIYFLSRGQMLSHTFVWVIFIHSQHSKSVKALHALHVPCKWQLLSEIVPTALPFHVHFASWDPPAAAASSCCTSALRASAPLHLGFGCATSFKHLKKNICIYVTYVYSSSIQYLKFLKAKRNTTVWCS